MVSKVLSKYGGTPPSGDNRKIKTLAPINPKDEVLSILKKSLPKTMTRKSIVDLQHLSFDLEDLKGLIKEALEKGKYRDSEWCQSKSESPWFACDSYELKKNEYVDAAQKEFEMNYFLKFCIHKSGDIVCTFSCHLSN
ncbi:hypothetical protein P256_00222 [Acinetobacter nectaris CIP 110549]|uniref:Uncharacterized protein n=1 Tax=Acinetobacter nectaris CIP 110549 TaxID=1392540 RepID=V2TGK0_9GAMM|nr:hypothetical protein [Acinetobacter nectaris]ESK41233.1 hypothetical protein P256_00222 [Acinetobacter nectaris CIP 110549]